MSPLSEKIRKEKKTLFQNPKVRIEVMKPLVQENVSR